MLEAQELVAVGRVQRPDVGEVVEEEDLHLVEDISGGLHHQPINGMVRICCQCIL